MVRAHVWTVVVALAASACVISGPPNFGNGGNQSDAGSSDGGPAGNQAVGGPCGSTSDCAPIDGGANCISQAAAASVGASVPGGYCTSAGCAAGNPTASCGAGTICGGFLGSTVNFCESACGDNAECREGFACQAGGCVPGAPIDGGNPGVDGGNPNIDGGNPGVDGGNPGMDGGMSCTTPTTISGTVHAPTTSTFGNADPIFGATVYVPSQPVADFVSGVSCQPCNATLSGAPIVQATTGADGKYTLSGVPAGSRIPLVIQVGRWRRQVLIPTVTACTNTAISDDLDRLPRTQMEGDIPQLAVVTGSADPLECVLRKIGIDDSEFTLSTGTGRVHVYVNNGSPLATGSTPETTLVDTESTMENYDEILFACPGAEADQTAAELANLIAYSNAGGRVLATHYNYSWLYTNEPFEGTATWDPDVATGALDTDTVTVDQTTAEGKAFANWLQNTGASTTVGTIPVDQTREDFTAVVAPGQEMLFDPTHPLTYSFETPITTPPSPACGRVMFSDFHVVSSTSTTPTGAFPTECDTNPMTPQEKALEFMLFNLGSCVQ